MIKTIEVTPYSNNYNRLLEKNLYEGNYKYFLNYFGNLQKLLKFMFLATIIINTIIAIITVMSIKILSIGSIILCGLGLITIIISIIVCKLITRKVNLPLNKIFSNVLVERFASKRASSRLLQSNTVPYDLLNIIEKILDTSLLEKFQKSKSDGVLDYKIINDILNKQYENNHLKNFMFVN